MDRSTDSNPKFSLNTISTYPIMYEKMSRLREYLSRQSVKLIVYSLSKKIQIFNFFLVKKLAYVNKK